MLAAMIAAALAAPVLAAPGPGISEALAKERAASISALRYELELRIPDARPQPIRGREVIRFRLAAPQRVVLDFGGSRDRLLLVTRAGQTIDFALADNHLTIPAGYTRAGENEFTIEFLAGDDSLNRSDEFLYTLFVPARAHLAFPCFDQPDMKGRYTLTLDVPPGWQAVANGAAGEPQPGRDGRYRLSFAETQPLSTYLFSFAAGKFQVEAASRSGRELRMFHRETDGAKLARNRDAIFDLHASALAWLEQYTGIPYPFGKFDFVLIPAFQFGGMEHAGAILYNAPGLMLDESATQNQYLGRASLIAHETAHMWFGNLVTMEWFNDVWMKEVFANFMAAKIVNPSFPEVNHELRFLLSHYPSAYEVDRTAGTNPIRQPLANLNEAGQLYGAIIYQKAPIVMRQLEMIIGDGAFRDGLRDYLKKYAFGNATWQDLIRILDAKTPQDLAAWSRAWVDERGRPEFTVERTAGAVQLTMRDPLGRGVVWPQRIRVTFGGRDGLSHQDITVHTAPTAVRAPSQFEFVLPNGGGLGYGLFLLDSASREFLVAHLEEVPDPLTRGAAWITLWDNMLEGHIAPAAILDLAARALPKETDEQNAQRVLNYVTRAYWRFLPQQERLARAEALEGLLRGGLAAARTSSQKSAWFSAFRDVVQTRDGLAWLERVWRREEKVPGLTFAETDEINMAMELAVREVEGWEQILEMQYQRTQNPDRKERFAFVRPALSADPAVRDASFERFRSVDNRRREPWVLEALQYLHHPLRAEHARRYIRPALDLLVEIRRTGDIFFPTRWMNATLGGHRSPEAAAIVHEFLSEQTDYPQRLRWTILTALDELARAAR